MSRIEEYFPVDSEDADYDPMLQRMYKGLNQQIFDVKIQPAPILHIDNPMGFCCFETNAEFIEKTEEGLRTLYAFRNDLRGYSRLLTFVQGIHIPAILWLIRLWHRLFGAQERRNLCGFRPHLSLFKIYRLGYYLSLVHSER